MAAEAILLLGKVSWDLEDIVAPAAFRFLVVGGIVPTLNGGEGRFPQVETARVWSE